MFNLSLTACSFYFKKSNAKKLNGIYNLNSGMTLHSDKITYQINSAKDLFESFFEHYSKPVNDTSLNKTFSCIFNTSYQGETEDFYYIYAVLKSGIYGSSAEIRDTVSNEIQYRQKASDVPERPFFLFVAIPKDSPKVIAQKGMLFFQNVGPYGVKTITTDFMQKFFSENFNFTIKCGTIAPQLFVKKVIRPENIKRLYMIKNHVSSDSADNNYSGYGIETRQIANLRFSQSMWSRLMDKIEYVSKGRHNLFEFENTNYDGLKVLVSIGGRDRMVNLHNLENLSIIEGIPDAVKLPDGHPKEDMLIDHFRKVATEYLNDLVVQIV